MIQARFTGTVGTDVFQRQFGGATADIDDASIMQPKVGKRRSDQFKRTDEIDFKIVSLVQFPREYIARN